MKVMMMMMMMLSHPRFPAMAVVMGHQVGQIRRRPERLLAVEQQIVGGWCEISLVDIMM